MLILGIDDAGRGPLIGPMVLAGVLIESSREAIFRDAGAKDSKLLPHPTRLRLAELIRKESLAHKVVLSSPDHIDKSLTTGTNLNTLEAQECAQIINELNDQSSQITVILDCPSPNLTAWCATVKSFINHPSNLTLKCEHKADFKYPVVSAASILAKVAREEAMSKIKEKYGFDGSGYPADARTIEFLKSRGQELSSSGLFRKTWSTWKKLYPTDIPTSSSQSHLSF